MKTRRRTYRSNDRRCGLAMLELVLYLPIMLFVMALMINFGNIAAWKIRAQGNTRYAAWRTLDDRTGQNDPHPPNWPQNATLATSGGNAMADATAIWNQQPSLLTPPVRGPVIAAGNQGGAQIIVPGRFDMDARVHAGDGHVDRNLPLLRGILRNNGRYGFTLHQELLDGRWEYRHLNWPANPYDRNDVPGDWGNSQRRAKRWWRMDPQFFGEIQGELQQLGQADARLKGNPTKFALDPLDRDNEFYWIRLRARLGTLIIPPATTPEDFRVPVPDFHPRAPIQCEIDRDRVKLTVVDPLVRRIERLPGTMGRAFAGLYSGEIARLKALKQALEAQMPPPAADIQAIQAEIDRLQGLLDQVNAFVGSIPQQNR
jgi:hypothetical protein